MGEQGNKRLSLLTMVEKENNSNQVQLNLVTVKYDGLSDVRLGAPETWPVALRFLFYPKPLGRQQFFGYRVALCVALIFFTGQIFIGGTESFICRYLYCLNMPVHESGHWIFGILNNHILLSLGGSLFQVMMPLVFCLVLLIQQRDLLGASVGLWWMFQNFIDVAPYIDDALRMKLTLINGVTGAESPYGDHDWNYILCETGLILKCEEIAKVVNAIGYVGIVLSCLWAGWSLYYYWNYQRELK